MGDVSTSVPCFDPSIENSWLKKFKKEKTSFYEPLVMNL